ncbi:hypothetical protein AMS59_07985 [Lysinibacillus sp. FJAT-14745]|nr:hypothetical protein AMS59_07985 [Lysinibacillus sp. FJAT-14745]
MIYALRIVDWSGGWATPRGSASQMRPCSEAKRLIGRPQESAQPERKSTPRFAEEPHCTVFQKHEKHLEEFQMLFVVQYKI